MRCWSAARQGVRDRPAGEKVSTPSRFANSGYLRNACIRIPRKADRVRAWASGVRLTAALETGRGRCGLDIAGVSTRCDRLRERVEHPESTITGGADRPLPPGPLQVEARLTSIATRERVSSARSGGCERIAKRERGVNPHRVEYGTTGSRASALDPGSATPAIGHATQFTVGVLDSGQLQFVCREKVGHLLRAVLWLLNRGIDRSRGGRVKTPSYKESKRL
jgi:hypothetical protein